MNLPPRTLQNHHQSRTSKRRRIRDSCTTQHCTAVILLLLAQISAVNSKACASDADCWTGSFCREDTGYCSNPFASGCFYESIPEWTHPRVCNSEDPPDAVERGLCRTPDFDYLELRIFADNWDSATFAAWILQVLLSEILNVPATIETGTTAQASFYHPDSLFQYGSSNEPIVLKNGNELGDCRLANRHKSENDSYTPCGHAILESWVTETFWDNLDSQNRASIVEPTQPNGMLGQEAWFVTKFTAEQDPSVVSYFGLSGQREKLAAMFLRPTTWSEYCDQESPNHCATPDGTAQRAPVSPEEGNHYFVPGGVYQGYFRATEENDCERWPDNCTGHVADYPCGWSSTVEAQAHHLDIALRSSGSEGAARGYQYSHLQEIWYAANATRSHVMMYYWFPEPLYHEFETTEAALIRVAMPPPTQECYNHKVGIDERCSPNLEDRVGQPQGVCDDLPDLLDKAIAASLYDLTHDPNIPEATRSPGYDAIRAYSMDNLQIGELLRRVKQHEHPRAAVCEWMVENMDHMQNMVPPTYPRVMARKQELYDPLILLCTTVGGTTGFLVALVAVLVIMMKNKRSVIVAQIEFLLMILAGAFLLTMGAILIGAPPTAVGCLTAKWLVGVGFTMQLVPLIVKMMAIHRMIAAAKRMRRVFVQRRNLFLTVASVVAGVSAFLLIWSVLDPSSLREEYVLTSERDSESGATIVETSDYCASRRSFWEYILVGWESILLLCSSVIAYQTRNLDPKFNESRRLAILIYSHSTFVLLRLVVLGLRGTIQEMYLRRLESVVLSLDTVTGLMIYFVPIILAKEEATRRQTSVYSTFRSGGLSQSEHMLNSRDMSGNQSSSQQSTTVINTTTNATTATTTTSGKPSLQRQIIDAKRRMAPPSFDDLSSDSSSSCSMGEDIILRVEAAESTTQEECPTCGHTSLLRQRRQQPPSRLSSDLTCEMAVSDVEDCHDVDDDSGKPMNPTEPSTEFYPSDGSSENGAGKKRSSRFI